MAAPTAGKQIPELSLSIKEDVCLKVGRNHLTRSGNP
jgi:hypothetical protein